MSACCDIMPVSEIHKNSFIVFFRKSGFIRQYTIAQKNFERTCADYRISGEKGSSRKHGAWIYGKVLNLRHENQ